MSVNGAHNGNLLFSSPGGGLVGKTPMIQDETLTTSTLLTFAEMVLALDRQNLDDNIKCSYSILNTSAKRDHNYASNRLCRVTRSQTAKAAAQISSHFSEKQEIGNEHSGDSTSANLTYSCQASSSNCNTSVKRHASKNVQPLSGSDSQYLKCKCKLEDCLKKESYKEESSHIPHVNRNNSLTVKSRICDLREDVCKSSPRKSLSFEEVSCQNNKCNVMPCMPTGSQQKTCVSSTLHRVVNNTVEFPYWPRKADHTYATATWDGTAASHNLFEHKPCPDSTKQNVSEDQEMEDVENKWWQKKQPGHLLSSANISENSSFLMQKEDHTYVKSNLMHCRSTDIVVTKDTYTGQKQETFSSATFPRQKTRDDHTYSHIKLSRRNSGGAGKEEWSGSLTVAAPSSNTADILRRSGDLQTEQAYNNLNSFSQIVSTKQDHNYSTSA